MFYYSIHGIVGIKVEDNYKWNETLICNIPVFITDENGYEKTNTKIHIKYNKKLKKVNGYEIVPFIFIDRINKIIFDKKYGAKIEKNDFGYEIECSQECNEWMMMILEYCFLLNGATFVHSAGVEKDGKAFVFPSWGGVGKTASVSKMVREHGFKLLGDDLVILLSDGTVKSFPKKFVLYAYHKKLFKDAMQKEKAHLIGGWLSSFLSKFLPFIKSVLRKVPGLLAFARRHNPQSKRICPTKIFGDDVVSKGGQLYKFTWLERINVKETRTEEIDYKTLSEKALTITIHELFDTRLQEFFIAICSGVFEYNVVFEYPLNYLSKVTENVYNNQLFIPIDYPIESVAEDVVSFTLRGL